MVFGGGVSMSVDGPTAGQSQMAEQSTILGDLKSEEEKLTEALGIALNEIATAKQDKRDAAQDE